MLAPVCVPCKREMQCHHNGRAVMTVVDGEPSVLYHGDEYRCEGCGALFVTGFGRDAFTESWMPSFIRQIADAEEHGGIVRLDRGDS